MHDDVNVQVPLPKPIIRPWEELVNNKHKIGLGYSKDVSFHIPNNSKPIQFQNVGFLYDNSSSDVSNPAPLPQQPQQNVKCHHCDRVGHMKNHRFDLHPCEHYHKTTHSSNRCFIKNKDSSWMDSFLVMGFNSQEDISVICQNLF